MAADKQNSAPQVTELCILRGAICVAISNQANACRAMARLHSSRSGPPQGRMTNMKRKLCVGATFLALIAALGFGSRVLERKAAVEAATVQAPMFEVDPMWPKPMPNHWVIGMAIVVSVDAQDNVWIIHRGG